MSTQKNPLTVIQQTLRSDNTVNELILAGSLPDTAEGKKEANKYIASILGEIERTEGTNKPISRCTPESIRQTLIDSMRFKVPIDGRKMAHVDIREGRAILQIDTNGFVAKIAEYYPDFHIKATPVFKGDDLELREDGTVRHVQKNPFCSDLAQLDGIVVQSTYTKGGRLIQETVPVSKADLNNMKAAAKFTQSLWNTWTIERMKTAAIKRVCKWHFRTIQGIQDIVDYDNTQNYDMNKSAEVKGKTLADTLDEKLSPKEHLEVIDVDIEDDAPEPTPLRDLDEEGTAAARNGTEALKNWRDSLNDSERSEVKRAGVVKELTAIAKEADEKNKQTEDDLF